MKKRTVLFTTIYLAWHAELAIAVAVGMTPSGDPVSVQGSLAANDPCASYIAEGTACEYLAFPDMEIKAGVAAELASIEVR